ncbi:MAG TPA: hypothetical protein DIU07_03570 [Rhodobacteraceae bacterium]|nr:hypothetical protein [Paracoccaceae bacterium]
MELEDEMVLAIVFARQQREFDVEGHLTRVKENILVNGAHNKETVPRACLGRFGAIEVCFEFPGIEDDERYVLSLDSSGALEISVEKTETG